MDRIQFATKTKRIENEIDVTNPPPEKLGISEGAVFEARKYGTAVLPKR